MRWTGPSRRAACRAQLSRTPSGTPAWATRWSGTGDLTWPTSSWKVPTWSGLARRCLPRAISRISTALDLQDGELIARARWSPTARGSTRTSALGPGGEIELPVADGIRGASLDQSRTTTFAAQVVRTFRRFGLHRAVEATERDLGVRFDDEVLRRSTAQRKRLQPVPRARPESLPPLVRARS